MTQLQHLRRILRNTRRLRDEMAQIMTDAEWYRINRDPTMETHRDLAPCIASCDQVIATARDMLAGRLPLTTRLPKIKVPTE